MNSSCALPDDQVAELMNWLLVTYSADELPGDFKRFAADEVAALRARPESNPDETRKRILRAIANEQASLAHAINATQQK